MMNDELLTKLSFRYRNVWFEKPWYGLGLKTLLERIDEKVQNNSEIIRQVLHIISWQNFIIKKLEGDVEFDVEMNSKDDWPENLQNYNWEQLASTMMDNANQIMDILKSKDDDFLNETVPGTKYKYEWMIEGIIQHDLYHVAQITLLDKQIKL